MLEYFVPAGLLFYLGYRERKRHNSNANSIPLRINVNGSRGKSTVTRLVTAMLAEAGMYTFGKTTGTSARLIYPSGQEKPIRRRPEGPNINEQMRIIAQVAQRRGEALVSECMAVTPDYQIVFQEELLRAQVGVVTNVLEDHLDLMGPTLTEVGQALAATIPKRGVLVTVEGPHLGMFREIAQQRESEVIVCDPTRVSSDYLAKFPYVLFPDNIALGLGVAQALGIEESVALKGMLKANPDPGVLRLLPLGQGSYFVNAFAANDPVSTLNIYKRIAEMGYNTDNSVVIMNCRPDRVDRTEQFANSVLPQLNSDILVLVGGVTAPIQQAYKAGRIPAKHLLNLENMPANSIIRKIEQEFPGRLVFGIGNIHGTGEPLQAEFENIAKKEEKLASVSTQ